ncbi:TAXI family TRAP transporter solute-binding subunit [Streptomyces sp. NPDC001549]|uniref:TAXI family TRAP transporter solute-binding subunit n=1 Tax=Streptomyces sp. NPDC001549 TaxID=3364586 RepID=UPI0036A9D213
MLVEGVLEGRRLSGRSAFFGRSRTAAASDSAGEGRLTIATGSTTGVYYQLGGGLAKLISDNIDGYRATATATGASVQNIQGLTAGTYNVAFSLLDTAGDAVNGEGSFTQPQQVEALTRLHPNYTQVLVRADSGITSLADMKGKRVSTGSPNSGTEAIARRLLDAEGLNPDRDVRAQRLGLPEAVDAMKDGTIDALFWSGGLPSGGIPTSPPRSRRRCDSSTSPRICPHRILNTVVSTSEAASRPPFIGSPAAFPPSWWPTYCW